MTAILAWHNNPEVKADAVARMRQHRDADRIIQGVYLDRIDGQWHGCFHGCLTAEKIAEHKGLPLADVRAASVAWHAWTEQLWGIPVLVGYALDNVFEMQADQAAPDWAVAATEAIPVGADLAGVPAQLAAAVLTDDEHGAATLAARAGMRGAHEDAAALRETADVWRRFAAGDEPTPDEWLRPRAESQAVAHILGSVRRAASTGQVTPVLHTVACLITGELPWWGWLGWRTVQLLAAAPVPAVDGGAR